MYDRSLSKRSLFLYSPRTRTVTQTETRLSRMITDMQEENVARHATTITTEVRGQQVQPYEQFSTTLTTDMAPQYQPVDLTIEVPIPPKFLQALKKVTAMEGTRVVFEGVVTGKKKKKKKKKEKRKKRRKVLY